MSLFTSSLGLLIGTLALSGIHGYKEGAPVAQCQDMHPGHYGATYNTANDDSPYTISADQYVYTPDKSHSITVTISSKPNKSPFKGFMLQARNNDGINIGHFSVRADSELQLLNCSGKKDTAVTHTTTQSKDGVSQVKAMWIAPGEPQGNVTFMATVVQHQTLVYKDLNTQPVVWQDSQDQSLSTEALVSGSPPPSNSTSSSLSSPFSWSLSLCVGVSLSYLTV